MSEAATKKLLEEIARLEVDFVTLQASCTTSEAATKIAEFCKRTADPFLGENEGSPNPWHQSYQSNGGCSIL
uniref:G protein gamma domain-containing protein n=1 Tax=Peronospora matthiolae TaxID=2874970 RepID=A0AAV1TZ87_9STRA